MRYFIRPVEDWIGFIAAASILLGVVSWISSCEPAHAAEPNEIVLQTIAMEGADQSLGGQALIASTLINRSLIRHTTPAVEALRFRQYSCWNDKVWAKKWVSRHFDTKTRLNTLKAYQHAKSGINQGITHYHKTNVKPYWAIGHKPNIIVGSHAFYKEIK